jgi:hypothetical protein
MRTIDTRTDGTLTASGGYAAHVRVRVDADGAGSFQDMTDLEGFDWVRSVRIREDVDSPAATATVVLHREIESLSLANLMTGSLLNAAATLVEIGRDIIIDTATTGIGTPPGSGDWVEQFRGTIEDVSWGTTNPIIVLECLDEGGELTQRFIESVQVYGATSPGDAMEDVIQDILDAVLGGSAPTLYTPTSPSFNLLRFKQKREPLLQACRNLAALTGWECRYRWDNGTGAFRLTLYTPDRAPSSTDRSFGPDKYWDISRANISRRDIRNKVQIVFIDTTNTHTTVTRSDATSQTKYGVRFMQIVEELSGGIDTVAEANAMGDALLADLKDPTLNHTVQMPFFFAAQLGDYYGFAANGVHYDADQSLGVVGIEHNFSESGEAETVLTTRGKPAAGVRRWLEAEGRPGVGPAADDYADAAADNVAITPHTGSIIVEYDDPRTMSPPISDWLYTKCHVSASSGFTPSDSNLAAIGRQTRFEIGGLVPGTTYYAKLVIYDESGNVAATSAQVTTATQTVGPYHQNTDTLLGSMLPNFDFGAATFDIATVPPDFWKVGTATEWKDPATSLGSIFHATDSLTGGRSIRVVPEAGYTGGSGSRVFVSEPIPAEGNRLYRVAMAIKRESGTYVATQTVAVGIGESATQASSESIITPGTVRANGASTEIVLTGAVSDGRAVLAAHPTSPWYVFTAYDVTAASTKYINGVIKLAMQYLGTPYNQFDFLIDHVEIDKWLDRAQAESNTATSIASGSWQTATFYEQTNTDLSSAFDYSGSSPFGIVDWTAYRKMRGSFVMQAEAAAAGLTSGKHCQCRIARGSQYWYGNMHTSAGTGGAFPHITRASTGVIEIDKGDVFTFEVLHDVGSAINFGGTDRSFIAFHEVGD